MSDKPSRNEEEYFAKEEYEKLRSLAVGKAEEMVDEERERAKELHWMHCPKCGMELTTLSMRGVEVDQCHSCQGIWLDAGELEKLVENEGSGPLKKLVDLFRS